jgi:hypothetical protein
MDLNRLGWVGQEQKKNPPMLNDDGDRRIPHCGICRNDVGRRRAEPEQSVCNTAPLTSGRISPE